MSDILSKVNDRLLEASDMAAKPANIDDGNKEVRITYSIKGKKRDIERLETIFSMINEASNCKTHNRITIELNMGLGGTEKYHSHLNISRMGGRLKKHDDKDMPLNVEKKANIYI
jgi:hypothetical protein